jgi:DNA repair protein RadC
MLATDSISIKRWKEDERPCERVIKYDSSGMSSDVHLLGILIGSGDRRARENSVDLSRDVLNKFLILENIDQASITKICHIQGIGAAKAPQIKAALKLGKKMSSKPSKKTIKMKSSRIFFERFLSFLRNLKKGTVKILLLVSKLQFINETTISEGSLNAKIVHTDS